MTSGRPNLVAAGAMARHRGRAAGMPARLIVVGLVITAILALSIQIGGEVTRLREEIQALRHDCDELQARQALLSVRWNAESSRQVVMRRAEVELDLVCPDEPGLLLVEAPDGGSGDRGTLVALGGGVRGGLPAAVAGERP